MDRTITALYDTKAHAEAAKQLIKDRLSGDRAHVDIISQGGADGAGSHDGEGFLERVKHFFMADEDKHAYAEGVRRGGYLLTARVDESDADEACRILDQSGSVDLDARQQDWEASGWNRQPMTGSARGDGALAGAGASERIPLAEERFKVGKRDVDRGTVRVRSFVEEEPVHERMDLREERVDVERQPVNRTVTGAEADRLFQERTIEMTERGEEPVISKEAVVIEEIGLRKQADQRTETIDDTVRKTRVEVDDERLDAAEGADGGGAATPSDRSFASREDHSVAMDADGESARETEEERERRLRDQPGGRPIPL